MNFNFEEGEAFEISGLCFDYIGNLMFISFLGTCENAYEFSVIDGLSAAILGFLFSLLMHFFSVFSCILSVDRVS